MKLLLNIFILLAICVLSSSCSTMGSAKMETENQPAVIPAVSQGNDSQDVEYKRASVGAILATSSAISMAPKITKFATLYYIPNRILDFFQILRFDFGVGISYGAVGRFTKWGNVGYRGVSPLSIRFGLHGRHKPVFVERQPEFGIGPYFKTNAERKRRITPIEVGLGADAIVAGLYAGVSFDELADFLLGFIFIDFKGDDTLFQ